jgi:hypothetical protein
MGLIDIPIAIAVIDTRRVSYGLHFFLVEFSKVDGNKPTFVHQAFSDYGSIRYQPKAIRCMGKVFDTVGKPRFQNGHLKQHFGTVKML